jgi:hypothetical protein
VEASTVEIATRELGHVLQQPRGSQCLERGRAKVTIVLHLWQGGKSIKGTNVSSSTRQFCPYVLRAVLRPFLTVLHV